MAKKLFDVKIGDEHFDALIEVTDEHEHDQVLSIDVEMEFLPADAERLRQALIDHHPTIEGFTFKGKQA